MKGMILIVILFISVTIVHTDDEVDKRSELAKKLIQRLISKAVEHISLENMDPAPLPDRSISYRRKVFMTKASGAIKLDKGQLIGLTSMKRADRSALEVHKQGTQFVLKTLLSFDKIKAEYRGKVFVMGVAGPEFKVNFKIGRTHIYLEVTQEDSSPAEVTDYKIIEMGRLSVDEVSGQNVLNRLAARVINKLIDSVKLPVQRKLKISLKSILANQLNNIKIDNK